MSKQYLDKDGLQVIANKVNKKISTVTEMPGNVSHGTVVLYKGEDTEQYSWGHMYESFNTMLYAWKDSENYVIYTDTETPENGSALYGTSNGQAATSENQPELVSFSVASYDSANSTITDTNDYTWTRESSLDFDKVSWDDITATVSGIKAVDYIPSEAKPGTAYLYVGLGTSHEYGHIYYCDGNDRYYAWGYEFRPDEWGYDYTLTPTPQVGDTTVNGGEITAVADDYSTITVNNRYWMRFSNRDYDNARWVDTTPIEIPTYDLINTGTAVEPVFDWIQICQNIKDSDIGARVPITFFKLYGRGYGSGTSYYGLSYFGIYNRKHNGATGPSDSLIEEFTIYAGTKLVVVHYDMSDRTWSYEESSIGADEEARETAAGAMALAQEAIDGLVPSPIVSKGTISFASLPSLNSVKVGWMYNISDAFITTSDFVISDIFERAGSNVYCIDTGSGVKKWDVFAAGNKTFELLTPPNSDYDTNGYLQNLEDPEGNLSGTISDWSKAKGVMITVDNGYDEQADNTYPRTMMSVTYGGTAPNTSANNTTDKKQTFIAMKSPTSESLNVCITRGTYGDRVVSRYFTMSIDTEGEYTITCPYSPKEDSDSESDLNWYVTKIRSIYIMY